MLGEGVIQRQRRQDSDNMVMMVRREKLACMSFPPLAQQALAHEV